jgi:glycosyltransferase involved in cell wall biosynthesis
MKVLNVIMSLDPVMGGGTVERTFQMSQYLVQAGIDCTILTTDVGLSPKRLSELDGTIVIALRCLNNRFFVPMFSFKNIISIVKNVDIIHLMGHWLFINALVYIIARHYKIPYVVCSAGLLPIYGRSRFLKNLYNVIVGKKIIKNANGLIAVTKDEVPHFKAYGVNPEKISIIPNGISQRDFQTKSDIEFLNRYGLTDIPFVLFVASLKYIKGPDLLLKAFCNEMEKLKPYHLVFVGPDGGMLSQLKDMVKKNSASERVHFLGYMGGVDKSKIYYASKLVVIPSRQEAMSIVVLEAGITSTPVLLTDQCGFSDIAVFGGGNVVPATVEGLQNGLIETLRETEKLNIMGKNINIFTRKHFTWDLIIEKHLSLYNQILVKKNLEL